MRQLNAIRSFQRFPYAVVETLNLALLLLTEKRQKGELQNQLVSKRTLGAGGLYPNPAVSSDWRRKLHGRLLTD
jgi:hypothetical protein